MLIQFDNPTDAQRWCNQKRAQGKSIGFIATMGALHAGHASLIKRAQSENDLTIVSIFVNPLQFNRQEDLQNYPRKQKADMALLNAHQVNVVFTGTPEQVLGDAAGKTSNQLTDPGMYAQSLEGAFRPGHFEGVREVVASLFKFVGECRAYFGEKDYQQIAIIKQLAKGFQGIDVVGCTTARQQDGLALSSRNFRLSDDGLKQAVVIYRAMQAANVDWIKGERQPSKLQASMLKILNNSMLDLEYAEVRDPENWTSTQPQASIQQARVFIAGNIEGVRLLDNMALT